MYEWSKEISKKIADSGCLTQREMQAVEIALRMSETHEMMLNESLGIGNLEMFELRHQIRKNKEAVK